MENKKVLLSVKDLHVKFRVRGRILTAIRGISLDFYENESVAIVGESGSGKSVFTKTFAGMLEPTALSIRVPSSLPMRNWLIPPLPTAHPSARPSRLLGTS